MSELIETEEERKRRLKREKMQRYRANRAARDARGIAPDQEFAAYARRAWAGDGTPTPSSPRRRAPAESTQEEESGKGSIWPLVFIGLAILAAPITAGLAMRRYTGR